MGDGQASTRGMAFGSAQQEAANRRQNAYTFTPPTISTSKYQELIALCLQPSQSCIKLLGHFVRYTNSGVKLC